MYKWEKKRSCDLRAGRGRTTPLSLSTVRNDSGPNGKMWSLHTTGLVHWYRVWWPLMFNLEGKKKREKKKLRIIHYGRFPMVSVATVISEGDRAKGRVKTVLLIWENGFDRQEFSKKKGHVNYCKKCYIPGNLQFIHRKKLWVVIYRLLCTHRTFFRNPIAICHKTSQRHSLHSLLFLPEFV